MAEGADRSPNRRLAWERRQRGWSYAELARRIRDEVVRCGEIETGLTANTVRRWEVGLRRPEPRYRKHLVSVFELPASRLGLLQPDDLGPDGDQPEQPVGVVADRIDQLADILAAQAGDAESDRGKRLALTRRRKALGLTQTDLARSLGVDVTTVRRWERGASTPSPATRPGLAEALDLSLDELDPLLTERPEAPAPPAAAALQRRTLQVLGGEQPSLASALGINDALSRFDDTALDFLVSQEPAPPAGIGPTEVEVIRTLTSTMAGIENNFGGAAAATAGLHQLRWARSLLTANAAPQIRSELVEAVGNLAQVVAFSLYDTERVDDARHCFNFALCCANEAGSWSLRACVLADIARLHADAADLDTALSAIEFAQVRHDRIPATGRAMLGVMRARYLAWDGRSDDARHQLDVADNWFAEADPTIDPPWLSYYDLAEHDGAAGRALAPIAIARKDPAIAAPRLRAAVDHQSADYPRSRLFSSLRLATLIMRAGDPDEATTEAAHALSQVEGIRSRRVIEELDRLGQACELRTGASSVVDLRQTLTERRAELTAALRPEAGAS